MVVHTTNAPLYVIVINLLTEAFFYTVILCLGLFFSFVAHMSPSVFPHPSEYCLTGRVIDIQESQSSFTESGNWLTCKGSRVRSEGQTTDWHAREPGLSQDQATVWHARDPGFIQRIRQLTDMEGGRGWFTESGNWLTYKRASVQYGVRQLTDIQESQCSVRGQAGQWSPGSDSGSGMGGHVHWTPGTKGSPGL